MTKQLTTYFVLAYILSWVIWFPLYGHIFGINNLPDIPFNHGIGGFGPLLSAFLTTWIYKGKMQLLSFAKGLFRVKPVIYIAIALLSPFLLAGIAGIVSFLIKDIPINLAGLFTSHEFPELNFIQFFFYNFVCFGLGEETGWRGFVLPHLQNKYNALKSSIIVTVFWALWHLPVFFYDNGFMDMNIGEIFGWFFSLLTGSILLTWIYNSSKASVLACAVFHTTINIAFSADFIDNLTVMLMGVFITLWGILTIRFFKPKNLSKNNRVINY
jgi:CAAX amino terminal protease family.